MRDDWWTWLLRAVWLSLPFAAGPLFGDALADTSRPVQLTATIGLWTLWAVGLLITLIPHHLTLTPLRMLAPGALLAAVWAAIDHELGGAAAVALSLTGLAAVLALSAPVGAVFVNGSSYGDEQRVLLRVPGPLLIGPLPLAWSVVMATAAAGPLLLAARQWVAGALVLAIGGFVSYRAVRALHALARRWVVFVPAGLVVHDPMTLADPVLIKRNAVERFGPALVDTDATDLTLGALGLALELRVRTPVSVALRAAKGDTANVTELQSLLIAVSQPGTVLEEAESRRITIG